MLNYMDMSFVSYLRARFRKKTQAKTAAYVEIYEDSASPQPTDQGPVDPKMPTVDFSYSGDLESYVRGLHVPRDVIEQWISTGLLFPDEMKMAEKMIQIMRRQEKEPR
jgi:hypothetical protein